MARTFVSIQARGTVALPADLRERYGLNEPGAQVEVVERDDGVIELHPQLPVPVSNVLRLSAADSRLFAESLASPGRKSERLAKALTDQLARESR